MDPGKPVRIREIPIPPEEKPLTVPEPEREDTPERREMPEQPLVPA
jgi:hypothetical protein